MEKKRSISYQETYKKNIIATNKQQIIDQIKREETTLFVIKAGRYEDGKEFITITIDNI
jgi:hypothetical protein